MNDFIKEFETEQIKTYELKDINELDGIMKVNKENSNLKIFHQNIRSQDKNLNELEAKLSLLKEDFDFIILLETRHLRNPNLYNLDNYNMAYNEGVYNNADGLVFVRKTISFKQSFINPGQVKTTVFNFYFSNRKMMLLAAYRDNTTCLKEFSNSLKDFLRINTNFNDLNIVIGGMNINMYTKITQI